MRTRYDKARLTLRYHPAPDTPPEPGVYEGGVRDPEHQSELALDVDGEAVHLYTTQRAAAELGRYLVALSRFDGPDPSYHDHLDGLGRVEGRPRGLLLVRGAPPLTGEPIRDAEQELDLELAYFDDPDASVLRDSNGPVPPEHDDELVLAVEPSEEDFTAILGGSRRALAALGRYLVALSRFKPRAPGYCDTLQPAGPTLIVHLDV